MKLLYISSFTTQHLYANNWIFIRGIFESQGKDKMQEKIPGLQKQIFSFEVIKGMQ